MHSTAHFQCSEDARRYGFCLHVPSKCRVVMVCLGRRLDCEGLILTRGLVPQMNLELNVILGFKGWSEECVTGVMDGHVMSSLSSAIPLSPAIWLWSL